MISDLKRENLFLSEEIWESTVYDWSESTSTLPPFGPIEGHSGFSKFPANERLRRTSLHLSFSAKSSFYIPAFEIPRSSEEKGCMGGGDL